MVEFILNCKKKHLFSSTQYGKVCLLKTPFFFHQPHQNMGFFSGDNINLDGLPFPLRRNPPGVSSPVRMGLSGKWRISSASRFCRSAATKSVISCSSAAPRGRMAEATGGCLGGKPRLDPKGLVPWEVLGE